MRTLVRIATLGFRGEALPSIGAAARLSLTSRPRGADHASTITVEGSHVAAVRPCAGAHGTRAVVRDLFFATPARRKFLRHPRTEAEHAEAAVRRLALASPAVAFRLESDGRTVFDLPGQDRQARVTALLGTDTADGLLPLAHERGSLSVSGLAGSPAMTRATGAGQHLVVNGRPVADPVLRTAVRVAYRDVIAAGRHPVVALFLDIPPEELDVNVHPAKTELRFRDPAAVRALVIGGIGRVLGGGAATSVPSPMPARRPALALAPPGSFARPPGFGETPLPFGDAPSARVLLPPEPHGPHPLGAPVAQVLDTYVIAVAADSSLVLVDQHAAHERLTHEALRAQVQAGGVRTQALLLPAVVDLPPRDAERLVRHADGFATLGLAIESFGAGAVLVRAMPAALGAPDPKPLLQDLADELADFDGCTALEARLELGDRPDGVSRQHPGRAAPGASRDGRAPAADGGNAARGDVQPRAPDLP